MQIIDSPLLIAILAAVIGGLATTIGTYYIEAWKTKNQSTKGLKLARHEDVVSWGWDGHKLLDKLIKLDYAIVPQLNEAREGTIDQWGPVFMLHPHSWTLLITRPKEIVGYWHFAAIKDEVYRRIREGKLLDSEITTSAILDLDVPGHYNAYFTLIGALEEYRRQGFPLLVAAFFDELANLAERGIYFKEFLANAYTEKGHELCKGFTMQPIKEHEDFGTIYALQLIPWPVSLNHKRFARAKEAYAYTINHNA